jgi:hypothetical protein
MSAFIRVSSILECADGGLFFNCPGCNMLHRVMVGEGGGERWTWNGNVDQPTFAPSILVRYNWGPDQNPVVCHSFVTDGRIRFLGDCTHHLAGQTVDIPDLDDCE